MERLLLVCLGGAVGSGARYLVSLAIIRGAAPGFPWATLAVNVAGSFLLSVLTVVALETQAVRPEWRLALGTGLLGGFTTYSTFNFETIELLQEGAWRLASLNLAATVLGCLAAGLLGFAAARSLLGQ